MKKSLIAVAMSAVLLGGLVGCGTSTTEGDKLSAEINSELSTLPANTTLTMWISDADSAAVDDLVAGFNKKYPDHKVTVNATAMAEGDVGKKYTSDPDNVPDISHVPGDVVNTLISGEYIASYPSKWVKNYIGNDISDSALEAGQDSDGNQYALPFSLNTFFMYYDTSVYGTSDVASFGAMDTAIAAYNTKNSSSKKTMYLDISNGWYGQAFFMADGEGILKNNGTSTTETYLGNTAALNVAKFIAGLYKNGNYELGDSKTVDIATCGSYVGGSWNYADIKKAWGADNIGMVHLPNFSLNGTDTATPSVGDYKSIVVSNSSKNKKMAQLFALYMVSAEGQKIRWIDNGKSTVPTSNTLNNSEEFALTNKFSGAVSSVMNNGTFTQNSSAKFSNWWDAETAFANSIKANPNATDDELKGYLSTLNAAILK